MTTIKLPSSDVPLRADDIELFLAYAVEAKRENKAKRMRAVDGCTVLIPPRMADASILDALEYLHGCIHGRITTLVVVS